MQLSLFFTFTLSCLAQGVPFVESRAQSWAKIRNDLVSLKLVVDGFTAFLPTVNEKNYQTYGSTLGKQAVASPLVIAKNFTVAQNRLKGNGQITKPDHVSKIYTAYADLTRSIHPLMQAYVDGYAFVFHLMGDDRKVESNLDILSAKFNEYSHVLAALLPTVQIFRETAAAERDFEGADCAYNTPLQDLYDGTGRCFILPSNAY